MTKKCYFVFDSRAEYDEDAAMVLEVINEDEYETEKQVKRYCRRAWGKQSAVLKSYDVEYSEEKGVQAANGKRVYFE